ncbi:MAG: hypothetical protein ABI067_14905, partial [Leifsonia sp.]
MLSSASLSLIRTPPRAARSVAKVVMLETKANQVPDEVIQQGIEMAKEENAKIIKFIESLRE